MPPKKRARASSSKKQKEDTGTSYQRPEVIDVEKETWDIRPSNISIFNPKLEYEGRPDRFTVALHHGGIFHKQEYIEGKLNYVDECSVLQFNLLELASIMLKLGYDRNMICEFYYCDPAYSDACRGTEVGHPLQPLIDDEHVPRFLKLATKKEKLMHIYALEITVAEAVAKQKQDEAELWKDFFNPKSKGVVIEETEEPPLVVPKRKPRKKAKVNPEIPLIGWYDRDTEFEDFLEDSLVKAREKWSMADSEKEDVVKDLVNEFNANVDQANIGESESPEGIADEPSAIQEPQADVGEPTTLQSSEVIVDESEVTTSHVAVEVENPSQIDLESPQPQATHPDVVVDESVEVASARPVVEANEPSHSVVEEAEVAQVEKAQGPEVRPAEWEDVYRPNLDHLEEVQPHYDENLATEPEGQFVGNLAEAHAQFEEYFVGPQGQCEENLGEAHDPVEEFNTNLEDCQLEEEVDMTDCPLHNEGFDGDDVDDLYQFISLANMCRDEQMFASYFAELTRHQEDVVEHPDEEHPGGGVGVGAAAAATGCTEDPSSSSIPSTSNARKTNKRRKYSPIIDKANQDARRVAEEAEMLDDLANTGVRDLYASDEEGGGKTGIRCRSFKLTDELPHWDAGDLFGDREYFKEVLQQYAVMSKRPVHIKINDKKRLRAVCRGADGDCPWFVYLHKKPNGDYVVHTLNRDHAHTCSEVQENKWITSKWLGKRFTEKVKANPHIPLTAIRQCVDEQYGSTLSRMKAYRAKDVALEGIYGNTSHQYKKLFYYKNELLRTHPDSSVHIHYEDHRRTESSSPRFVRIYICLGPLKIGWKRFCRPIIFLDACFLRGMYKGQIFTAIGIDPNNGWWPIAWAVAETESYEQWKWFLDHLDDDLELSANGPRYVFMSDQQKGLGKIIAEKYPQSEHRFCVQHMYNNFKKRFSGDVLKKKMWGISDSTTEEDYEKNMDAMRVYNQAAYQHLVGVAPKERWVKAYFSGHAQCDTQLNNMCETFNSKIVLAREKPILTLLEELRTQQLERIQIRGQWVKNYNFPVPPVIKEILDKTASESTSWRPLWNGENEYQVTGPVGQFVVNMRARTCTCRLWQISGIPCVHAASCILKTRHPLTDYVSPYYSRISMAALYEHVLYPINGMENWPRNSDVGFELDPPNTKRQRGRPRKIRREQVQVRLHENGVESLQRAPVMTCGRCGQPGHNKRTCQNDPRVSTSQRSEPSAAQGSQVPNTQRDTRETTGAPSRQAPTTGPSSSNARRAQRCGRRRTAD